MAQLTEQDFQEMRDAVYRLGHGKEELKAEVGLPTETSWRAAFQAIEDGMVAASPGIKVSVQTALGRTITATLYKKLFRVWLRWRDKQGG